MKTLGNPGSAMHLFHGVQCFDSSFRECGFSATSVYVLVSSKLGVSGTEHRFTRNLYVARRSAAVRRCSFRFEGIGSGAARETEGNTCNEMPAFAPFRIAFWEIPYPARTTTTFVGALGGFTLFY